MNKFRHIFLVLMTLAMVSCEQTIFEYPNEPAVDPTLVNFELRLRLQKESVEDYKLYDGIQSLSRAEAESYELRTIVEIYDVFKDSETPMIREYYYNKYLDIENYAIDLNYALNAKQYKIMVWADVINNTQNQDLYYTSSDLRNILPILPYQGATDLKHCFAETCDFDLRSFIDVWGGEYSVTDSLERPLSRFEIIATDLEKFLDEQVRTRNDNVDSDTRVDVDLTKYTIKLNYDGYMPYGYNVESDLPNRAEQGVVFTSKLEPLDTKSARLTFDNIFVNHTESNVNVTMTVYNDEGVQVVKTSSIQIPLKRNRKTIITGDFLTRTYAPGVSIDPSFEGDINVWVD